MGQFILDNAASDKRLGDKPTDGVTPPGCQEERLECCRRRTSGSQEDAPVAFWVSWLGENEHYFFFWVELNQTNQGEFLTNKKPMFQRVKPLDFLRYDLYVKNGYMAVPSCPKASQAQPEPASPMACHGVPWPQPGRGAESVQGLLAPHAMHLCQGKQHGENMGKHFLQ